jgi:hypothetical protein
MDQTNYTSYSRKLALIVHLLVPIASLLVSDSENEFSEEKLPGVYCDWNPFDPGTREQI